MRYVVLDTSVVVSAFRSRHGASSRLLTLVADGILTPLLTTSLFLEYEDVLKRPEQRAVHGLSPSIIDELLVELASLSAPVDIYFRLRPLALDPNDDLVLEAAVNGGADALITHNVRHLAKPGAEYGVAVLTPGAILKRVAI